jgi:hypothetical protein
MQSLAVITRSLARYLDRPRWRTSYDDMTITMAARRILRRPIVGALLHHGAFATAVVGAAAIRVLTMLGYPGVLWFTGDSYFYLGHALRPTPSPSKTLGYPFVLRLLEPLHSLTLVAALQHLLGLATAVMVYALLRRAGLPGLPATLVTLPVLYDAYQIQLEQLLMAESVFTFLIATAVTLMLWHRRPAWWAALLAGSLLGYAVLVRTAGAAMIPVAVGCLMVRRAGWRACVAAAVGGVVPLAAYAIWFHSYRGVYALTTSDGIFLWGRTATFADCARIRPPPEQRFLCLHAPPRERLAPGTLIWRREAPPRHMAGGAVSPANNLLLRDFALRAITAQPGDYLHTIADGVGKAVSPRRFRHPNPATERLYHFPDRPRTLPSRREWARGGTAVSDAWAYGRAEPSRVVEPYAGMLRGYQDHVFLPGPVFGALLLVGAAGIVVARGRRTAVFTAWATAVTLLVFPIATADFDYRYALPAVPFGCLAAGLALLRSPAGGKAQVHSGHRRWRGVAKRVRRCAPAGGDGLGSGVEVHALKPVRVAVAEQRGLPAAE